MFRHRCSLLGTGVVSTDIQGNEMIVLWQPYFLIKPFFFFSMHRHFHILFATSHGNSTELLKTQNFIFAFSYLCCQSKKDVPSRWTTNMYVNLNFLHYYFLHLVPVKLEVLVSTVGERSWFHVPFRLGFAFPRFAPRITFRCPWNYSVVRYDGERVFPPRNPHVLVI